MTAAINYHVPCISEESECPRHKAVWPRAKAPAHAHRLNEYMTTSVEKEADKAQTSKAQIEKFTTVLLSCVSGTGRSPIFINQANRYHAPWHGSRSCIAKL